MMDMVEGADDLRHCLFMRTELGIVVVMDKQYDVAEFSTGAQNL